MLSRDLMRLMEGAPCNREICVAVHSVETGREIAVTHDIAMGIGEYGEWVLHIAVEAYNAFGNSYDEIRCNLKKGMGEPNDAKDTPDDLLFRLQAPLPGGGRYPLVSPADP